MISAENTVCIPCVCEFRQPLSQVLCPDSARCLFCGASQFQTSGPFRSEGRPAQRGSGSLGTAASLFPEVHAGGRTPPECAPPPMGLGMGRAWTVRPYSSSEGYLCQRPRNTAGRSGNLPGRFDPEGRAASRPAELRTKGHPYGCPFVLGPAAQRRLHPSVF